MKLSAFFFGLTLLLASCSSTTVEDLQVDLEEAQESIENIDNEDDSDVASDESEESTEPEESESLDGTYTNGDGKIVISNSKPGEGFSYHIVIDGSMEDCQGIDYEGTATFDSENHAISSEEFDENDDFTINGTTIILEPAMSMIGMDCAKFVETEFKK